MNQQQQTIEQVVELSGIGLHSGKQATITFKPALPNHGIQFCRTDLPEKPCIKALAENVVNTQRSTTVAHNHAQVITIEHVMAALSGLEIDNVLVEIDNEEVPILDGSALPFIQVLTRAGIVRQEAPREFISLDAPFRFTYTPTGSEYIVLPANAFEVTALIDYNSSVLGKQYATLTKMAKFATEIAPARTFCFISEIEPLLQHNLIKGGSLNNAIVYLDRQPDPELLEKIAQITGLSKVSVNTEGYLNNVDLYFDNEAARHKLLDVVGDVALLGAPLCGRIIAIKPGHAANVAFVKELKKELKKKAQNTVPYYDPNATPVYDVTGLQQLLPHRPPFLLVDKIMLLTKERVVAVKNVTINEPFFIGHFPGHPVMPGVMIIEALAQAGGALVMQTVPDPENYLTFFLRVDQAKFRKPVVPGDTLIFELKLASEIRRGICEMDAFAWVGNKLVTEAKLVAQIARRK
ncbi:bifunctional UDP-3-O-[3-hydroxymyristoyl] N-acetylglucosamine deacetylase/3-hydroxyacyl-ACP dehydratase [Sphingobacteriales bacterium UPWRP_1]|nr:UDP-3-O-[3-hydroxymyristoyl] N-acetylglucosamine deacetylase [Sphingobacteriales bacterium TSM_CSS]PSJ76036.1 bifunctional UDP-3-O-[3-hydroxymyristoyl] N-acetylglucosamine deacetylase/3-hydroxyacyl-ACP dehydratase [Sphingobacteriales bacterium UPWRP_1]